MTISYYLPIFFFLLRYEILYTCAIYCHNNEDLKKFAPLTNIHIERQSTLI